MKVADLKVGYLYRDNNGRGHCKNGTYIVKKNDEGETLILDTYWLATPNWMKTTDEFVEKWEEVLKLSDYVRVNGWSKVSEYSEEDFIQAHYTQCSGRFSDDLDFFLKNGAVKITTKVLDNLKKEYKSILRTAENLKKQIEELEKSCRS